MDSPRNAAIIGIQILQVIPDSNKEFKDVLTNLIYNDFPYCSPEMLTFPASWDKLQAIMYKYIPVPNEEWEKKAVEIFIGTPIE